MSAYLKELLASVQAKPSAVLLPALLAAALSPGFLLSLPGASGKLIDISPMVIPNKNVIAHAIVFAIALAVLRKQFPDMY